MPKHQIRLSWSDTRKGLLTLENKVLVDTINIFETGPQLMTYSSLTLPPKTLAVINVHVDLKGNSTEHTYEVKPNSFPMDQYLNMIIIPVIHITPIWTAEQPDTPLPYSKGQFICSPSDISVHRNVDLKDAEVSKNI